MEDTAYLRDERDKIVKSLEEAYGRLVEFKKPKNSSLVVLKMRR